MREPITRDSRYSSHSLSSMLPLYAFYATGTVRSITATPIRVISALSHTARKKTTSLSILHSNHSHLLSRPQRYLFFLRGFAFVAFVMLEDSDRAIEALNGSQLAGRTIKVEKARRGGGYEKTPGRCIILLFYFIPHVLAILQLVRQKRIFSAISQIHTNLLFFSFSLVALKFVFTLYSI